MINDDGTVVIVFNGEIYNFRELQRLIRSRGYKLFSNSDTEVILRMYEIFGMDSVRKLRGMFAFAIWDQRKRILYLVRDRVGIKPLYFAITKDRLVFASEVKAILAGGFSERTIDSSAFLQYFKFLVVPQPRSIFKGIKKLMPGTYMRVEESGRIETETYWDAESFVLSPQTGISDAASQRELKDMLIDSVRAHKIADVPVGAFLSGGLDSSAMVALMHEVSPSSELQTFSTVFPGMDEYDESKHIEVITEKFGAVQNLHVLSEDLIQDFDRITWTFDEPFAISSGFALFYLAQIASRKVKVVLTGDGADELFAGYSGYDNWHYLQHSRLFQGVGQIANSVLNLLPNSLLPDSALFRRGTVALEVRLGGEGVRYSNQTSQNALYNLGLAFSKDYFRAACKEWKRDLKGEYYDSLGDAEQLTKRLYTDYKTRLVDEMLMKVDRATMAHSLEARPPILDHNIVEFALSCPNALKRTTVNGQREGKLIFKKAMEGILPHETIYRSKHPYNVPLFELSMEKLLSHTRSVLYAGALRKNGVITVDGLDRLFDLGAETARPANMLFLMLCFEYWYASFSKAFGNIGLEI